MISVGCSLDGTGKFIGGEEVLQNRIKNADILRLVTAYREHGHKSADVNPLNNLSTRWASNFPDHCTSLVIKIKVALLVPLGNFLCNFSPTCKVVY